MAKRIQGAESIVINLCEFDFRTGDIVSIRRGINSGRSGEVVGISTKIDPCFSTPIFAYQVMLSQSEINRYFPADLELVQRSDPDLRC